MTRSILQHRPFPRLEIDENCLRREEFVGPLAIEALMTAIPQREQWRLSDAGRRALCSVTGLDRKQLHRAVEWALIIGWIEYEAGPDGVLVIRERGRS